MASLRRINQDDLRNHNLSVVIDTLLRASGPMSRADLAKETGLTKATMSLLVSLLIDAGVVKEGEPQNSASYGRPSTPLMLGGGKVCGIGMQVNTDGYGCMALDINHDILRLIFFLLYNYTFCSQEHTGNRSSIFKSHTSNLGRIYHTSCVQVLINIGTGIEIGRASCRERV